MPLLCKCMRIDCPHPHYSDLRGRPDDDYDEVDDRCQPIGCDGGIHVPGCKYIERDKEEAGCGADDVAGKEDKSWPPKNIETK